MPNAGKPKPSHGVTGSIPFAVISTAAAGELRNLMNFLRRGWFLRAGADADREHGRQLQVPWQWAEKLSTFHRDDLADLLDGDQTPCDPNIPLIKNPS